MLATIVKLRAMSRQRAVTSALRHSNNDRTDAKGAVASRPTRRPVLACRWRTTVSGRLECYWSVAFDEGAAIEEPDGRWLIGLICRLLGIGMAGVRPRMPAMG